MRAAQKGRAGMAAGALAAVAALASAAVMAQETADWCGDHPLFPAPPGFKCADKETQKLGAEEFLLEENGEGTVVEGRREKIKYYLQKDASPADPSAVISYYRNIVMGFPSPKAWLAQDENGRAAGFFTPEGGRRIFIKVLARPEEVELTIVETPFPPPARKSAG